MFARNLADSYGWRYPTPLETARLAAGRSESDRHERAGEQDRP